ncbi:MAG: hypothetical protein ACFE95_12285 [Candidatus Hodarchaeota archaeon]
MSKKKEYTCGKHKKSHHREMNQSEMIEHVKDCLTDVIERLACIKEAVEKIPTENQS